MIDNFYVKACKRPNELDQFARVRQKRTLSANWYVMNAIGKLKKYNGNVEEIAQEFGSDYIIRLFQKEAALPTFGEQESLRNNLINLKTYWDKVKDLEVIEAFYNFMIFTPEDFDLAKLKDLYANNEVTSYIDMTQILKELFDENGHPVDYTSAEFKRKQKAMVKAIYGYVEEQKPNVKREIENPTHNKNDDESEG